MNTVFIDIDTQLDFLFPAGALYAPGAERLVPALAHLTRYAAAHGIPIVSTVDAHTEDDPEFKTWPKHCVAGATGQHKAGATVLAGGIVIPNRNVGIAMVTAPQIVVEKQTVDAFQTHTFADVVRALQPDRLVVYGVVTEVCVLHAVRGLLRFGKLVAVVTDAVQALSSEGGTTALDEMRAAGAQLLTTAEATP